MELPRETAALELLCLDRPRQRVTRYTLGEVDRDRRPRREDLREPLVVRGEARIVLELVDRLEEADRRSRATSGT